MEKTYSSKSNAKRAAKAAGLVDGQFTLAAVDGRWAFHKVEPKVEPKAEPQAEVAAKPAPRSTTPRKTSLRPDGLREGTALALMVDLVLRPGGATMAELLEATGWKQCRPMLVKACQKAGVKLELQREGRAPGRYVGTRA